MHKALGPLLGLVAVWGCSFLFIKVADEGLTPIQISAARIVLGALTLVVLLRLRGERLPRERALWPHLFVVGLFNNALPFCLLAWGEQRISSSLAGVFNATTALWTAAVSLLLLPDDRMTGRRAAGLLIGFGGVLLVFAPWRASGGTVTGDLACVGAGLCYGIGFTWTRIHVQGRGSSLELAGGQLVAASAEILVAAAVAGRHHPEITWRLSGSVLMMGIFGTGVAYVLMLMLIAEVGPTRASTVTYLVPIVAVALGVAVLGEALSWTTVVGAVVILGGVGLTSTRPRGPGHNRAERAGIGLPTVRT